MGDSNESSTGTEVVDNIFQNVKFFVSGEISEKVFPHSLPGAAVLTGEYFRCSIC
jgi:hypothetical protein